MCSHIFIIHNEHAYITEDYTKLCLNIICNRSFFLFWNDVSFVPIRVYTRMNRYWGENISLPHAQTAIYDSKVKLFLKQGISHQLGRDAVDLNARIQQMTWSLILYEKYSTSLSTIVLVVFTTANFGGFSNFCRYYTRSQTGKRTGYWPTLKPLINALCLSIKMKKNHKILYCQNSFKI